MPFKSNESFLEFRARMMDPISSSFCAAKWYNATIWFGSGKTSSCHHPEPLKIPLEEVAANPTAIHNTKHKKEMRKMMLQGLRPAECDYCWRVEDMDRNNVSDRVFQTLLYKEEEVSDLATLSPDADVDLRTLEVSFDRNCNLLVLIATLLTAPLGSKTSTLTDRIKTCSPAVGKISRVSKTLSSMTTKIIPI
jgi:hypothetical protein